MTSSEKNIAASLASIMPVNDAKEGRFIDQLPSWHSRDMTDKGREYMLRLLDRYAHRIPDAHGLRKKHMDEQLDNIG